MEVPRFGPSWTLIRMRRKTACCDALRNDPLRGSGPGRDVMRDKLQHPGRQLSHIFPESRYPPQRWPGRVRRIRKELDPILGSYHPPRLKKAAT
jgi:hypothetical protein